MKAELIDRMGTDLSVVNSARVSFSKESDYVPNPKYNPLKEEKHGNWSYDIDEKDQKLIKYLAKHNHWTPFSHVQITMREKVPIFVARQRFKHMVGFTYNEVSRRYVDDPPEFYFPDKWRSKPENAKQGSSDKEINLHDHYFFENDDGSFYNDWTLGEEFNQFMDRIGLMYKRMIDVGVAPEQARMVLPQSMYTEYFVTGSLAAWARAYKLRSDPHAQKEIQELAKQWDDIISSIDELRYSWEALKG